MSINKKENQFSLVQFHFDLKDLCEFFIDRINKKLSLTERSPNDWRTPGSKREINIYMCLFNYLRGDTNCVPSNEDYDYMVKCFKEMMEHKGSSKIKSFLAPVKSLETVETVETVEESTEQSEPFEFITQAPETTGQIIPNSELLVDVVGEKEKVKVKKTKTKTKV